jgi:alkanesulfonate monooxygenase SsuD/methylene tetrahydromethanopterin reductase-like flavin-dependent oxidoreductase (luciferase family)
MAEEAMNFGLDGNIDHGNRYERAGEYIDLVKALWDSVEDGAILLNRETGYFADPHRIHRINHTGKYFKVRGPLNVPRPPQGQLCKQHRMCPDSTYQRRCSRVPSAFGPPYASAGRDKS